MATMTLRGVDERCIEVLKERAKQEGTSLNTLMLRLLREALGLEKKKRDTVYTDLDALAGTWSDNDAAEFAQATSVFEKIDEELWK